MTTTACSSSRAAYTRKSRLPGMARISSFSLSSWASATGRSAAAVRRSSTAMSMESPEGRGDLVSLVPRSCSAGPACGSRQSDTFTPPTDGDGTSSTRAPRRRVRCRLVAHTFGLRPDLAVHGVPLANPDGLLRPVEDELGAPDRAAATGPDDLVGVPRPVERPDLDRRLVLSSEHGADYPGSRPSILWRSHVGSVEAGSVDQLLDVTVESPALEELQVEVGSTREDRVRPGPTGDDRKDRHLHAVDQAGSHQRPVQGEAAMRAQGHVGLLLEPADDVDAVTALDGRVRPVE